MNFNWPTPLLRIERSVHLKFINLGETLNHNFEHTTVGPNQKSDNGGVVGSGEKDGVWWSYMFTHCGIISLSGVCF